MVSATARLAENSVTCTHESRSSPHDSELERGGDSIHVKGGELTDVPLSA